RSAEIRDSSDGDGKEWTVPLGPPFLSFTQSDVNDHAFVSNAVMLLSNWVAIDRRNIIRALQGVPYVEGIKEWATNVFATTVVQIKQFMAWSASPQSVAALTRALEPLLVNLGVHLQAQGD